MSQDDIYVMLKSKRLSGDNKYYSAEEIRKILKEKGIDIGKTSVNNNLLKLRVFGFLDTKIEATKNKRIKHIYVAYRLKKEYLE